MVGGRIPFPSSWQKNCRRIRSKYGKWTFDIIHSIGTPSRGHHSSTGFRGTIEEVPLPLPRKLIHGSLTIINIRIIIPAMVLCAQDLVNRVDCSWLGDGQILRLPQIQRSRCTWHQHLGLYPKISFNTQNHWSLPSPCTLVQSHRNYPLWLVSTDY